MKFGASGNLYGPHGAARVNVIIEYMAICIWLISPNSLVAQVVKNPPAMQETPVRFLGLEDPLEK